MWTLFYYVRKYFLRWNSIVTNYISSHQTLHLNAKFQLWCSYSKLSRNTLCDVNLVIVGWQFQAFTKKFLWRFFLSQNMKTVEEQNAMALIKLKPFNKQSSRNLWNSTCMVRHGSKCKGDVKCVNIFMWRLKHMTRLCSLLQVIQNVMFCLVIVMATFWVCKGIKGARVMS